MTDTDASGLELLRDLGAALRKAEAVEAQQRHGSTIQEYEAARRLGEGLAAEFETSVKAVRDLPDNAGVQLIIPYRGTDHALTIDFDTLARAVNTSEVQDTVYTQWRKDLRSTSTKVPIKPPDTSGERRSKRSRH